MYIKMTQTPVNAEKELYKHRVGRNISSGKEQNKPNKL